jgi:hypothetical protein
MVLIKFELSPTFLLLSELAVIFLAVVHHLRLLLSRSFVLLAHLYLFSFFVLQL